MIRRALAVAGAVAGVAGGAAGAAGEPIAVASGGPHGATFRGLTEKGMSMSFRTTADGRSVTRFFFNAKAHCTNSDSEPHVSQYSYVGSMHIDKHGRFGRAGGTHGRFIPEHGSYARARKAVGTIGGFHYEQPGPDGFSCDTGKLKFTAYRR